MKYLLPYTVFIFLVLAILNPPQAFSAVNREQELREAVTSFIVSRNNGMGWDVTIRRITVSDKLKLPEGKVEYDIIAPQQWEGWGNVSLTVIIRQNDRVVRNIPVRVDVDAMTDMVVALHRIERGELLYDADVILQKREISDSSRFAARSVNDVTGKKARTSLQANHPVRTDQIERVPLVKPGQMVTIIAENELLKISVTGKARSAGAEGDTIRVQNLASLKEIPARVISATTVQVAF